MDKPNLPLLDPAIAAVVEQAKAAWIEQYGFLEYEPLGNEYLCTWERTLSYEVLDAYEEWLGECYDIESCWEMSQQEPDKPYEGEFDEVIDSIKCPSCSKNEALEEHTCPYSEEINYNYKMCTCCLECRHECSMDI